MEKSLFLIRLTRIRNQLISDVLTYMNTHFCEDLEIAELASQFFI